MVAEWAVQLEAWPWEEVGCLSWCCSLTLEVICSHGLDLTLPGSVLQLMRERFTQAGSRKEV